MGLYLSTPSLLALLLLGRFFLKAYTVRRKSHKLHGPPHSWIWGHLQIYQEATQAVPFQTHPHCLPALIQKKYNLKNYFYLDLWPFANPTLHISDPELSRVVTQEHSLPKYATTLNIYLNPLCGEGNMVVADGPHWKKWRSIFNPGFASSHLMTLVPYIVDESVTFTNKLRKYGQSCQVFRMEEDATRLTVDIIGKVCLNVDLGTQNGENEMVTAFREQLFLLPGNPYDPIFMWEPIKWYRRWRNSRIMEDYIGNVLDRHFSQNADRAEMTPAAKRPRKRAILDLALEAYKAQGTTARKEAGDGFDAEFRREAITQIRTFIFAGHDTTASMICYMHYLLAKHPECLRKLREEHDRVLGARDDTPQVIKDNPHILLRLEYTLAVVRESLRLYPPVSSMRQGDPSYVLRDPKTGEVLPTEDFVVWVLHASQHRNEDFWGPTANRFDPSRFMPENAASLPESAFRPFEKGPRNCIGQDLALIEARILLALTARRFDFTPAFDRLDELKSDGSFYAKEEKFRQGKQDLDGDEVWQILVATAKPREGMPMTVEEIL